MTRTRRAGVTCRLCQLVAVSALMTTNAAAQAKPKDAVDWNTLVADVTITQSSVGADAALGPARRSITYRWEATEGPSGLKTRLTPTSMESPVVRTKYGDVTLTDTVPFVSIEDPGDGSGPVLRDHRGKPIVMSDSDRQLFTKLASSPVAPDRRRTASAPKGAPGDRATSSRRAPLKDFVIDQADGPRRHRDLERSFGRAKEKVRRLDRYVAQADDRAIEVLADPGTGAVLEMNMMESGALHTRTTWEYAPHPSGKLVRHRVRTERVAANGKALRTVTDIVFDNVRFERRTK